MERVEIDYGKCVNCGKCDRSCPTDVFRWDGRAKPQVAYPDDCCDCMLCVDDCPADCITIDRGKAGSQFTSIYDQLPVQ